MTSGSIKTQSDKLDCFKMKTFLTSKDTGKTMKRQVTDQGKILANYVSVICNKKIKK